MKICLVSNLYPPLVHGGAEIYVGRLARALAQDHQVVVITTEPGSHLTPTREFSSDGVVTYRLAPINVAHLTTLPHRLLPQAAFRAIDLYHPQIAATVRDIMVRERPQVVHVHNWVGISLAAVLASVNAGSFDRVPVAMTLKPCAISWRTGSRICGLSLSLTETKSTPSSGRTVPSPSCDLM